MKIKEVIEKTKLTDRAIRLYIENGLVHPRFTENYNGRKNIDFTEDDLKTLQNIATLRKADFSIAEIKSITEGSQNCKSVLEEFIRNKTDKIENDTKIVEALSPLLSTEEPDINSICEKLNAVTADKTVPKEDTKTPVIEKIERIFFLAVAGVGIVYSLVIYGFNVYFYTAIYQRKYIYFDSFTCYVFVLFALIFAIPLFYLFMYSKHLNLKRRIIRTVVALILTVPLGFSAVQSCAFTLLTHYNVPLLISQTDNPSNYLDVDKEFGGISDIFPEKLPEYADKKRQTKWLFKTYPSSTEYFYRFGDDGGKYSDLFAQWHIPDRTPPAWKKVENPPEDELKAIIEKYKNKKALNGEEPIFKTKGTWEMIYYADSSEADFRYGYNYVIFAYNTDRRLVRFIQSSNGIVPCGNDEIPYYLTLDWYS